MDSEKNPNEKLDAIFGFKPKFNSVTPAEPVVIEAEPVTEPSEELNEDFQEARAKVKDTLDRVQKALGDAIVVAGASETPKAYEVVAKLVDSLNGTAQQLLDLHSTKKDIELIDTSREPLLPVGETAIALTGFAGRMSDLLRSITEAKKTLDKPPSN